MLRYWRRARARAIRDGEKRQKLKREEGRDPELVLFVKHFLGT